MENIQSNLEYINLKGKVINSLKVFGNKMIVAKKIVEDLKSSKTRELDKYKDAIYNEGLELKKALLLEQYNNQILKKENEIKGHELYVRRITTYLNCIYYKVHNKDEEYVDSLKELEGIIGEEVNTYYNNQIKEIRQKRILFQNENAYMDMLKNRDRKSAESFKRETSLEEVEEDMDRQYDIEDERRIAENIFGSINLQISINDVDTIAMLDDNPIRVAKATCPLFKDKILGNQEGSYTGKKAG